MTSSAQRSIRVEGKVARVPEKESDDYFHSRFETLHSQCTFLHPESWKRFQFMSLGRCQVRSVPVCPSRAPSFQAERWRFLDCSYMSVIVDYLKPSLRPPLQVLTSKEEELEKKYVEGGETVPRPHWGGYRQAHTHFQNHRMTIIT